MKRPPMFLMMLLATAMSEPFPAGAAQGRPAPRKNAKGLAQALDDECCDLEETRGARVNRLKPAA